MTVTSWIEANYQTQRVGGEDGVLIVEKKGKKSTALVVKITEDGKHEGWFDVAVSGNGADARVVVSTDSEGAVLPAYVRKLKAVLTQAGAKPAKKEKAPPGKKWFDGITLGQYGCSGAHVADGRIYRTDGRRIIHTELAGKPPKDVCTKDDCTVLPGIKRILQGCDKVKRRAQVDAEELGRMLRAMKALQVNESRVPEVTLKLGGDGLLCTTTTVQKEEGEWTLDLVEPWKGAAFEAMFNCDFLLQLAKVAGARLEIAPRSDEGDPWGFDGETHKAVVMPLVMS